MTIGQIEETMNKVDFLLQDRGLGGEYQEQAVRQLLYHLFVAVDIYKYMTVAERNKAGWWYRNFFKNVFSLTGFLKERKRKREKEKSPLHPSYKKDSGVLEKGEKNTHTVADAKPILDDDQLEFWNECSMYINNPYDEQMVRNFFHYWAEKDDKSGKMLWQTKRTWNTKFRLIAWSNNSNTKRDEAASIDLRKKKQREATQASAPQQSKSVGVISTQEMEQQEAEIAKRKAGAVTKEDYLRMKAEGKI